MDNKRCISQWNNVEMEYNEKDMIEGQLTLWVSSGTYYFLWIPAVLGDYQFGDEPKKKSVIIFLHQVESIVTDFVGTIYGYITFFFKDLTIFPKFVFKQNGILMVKHLVSYLVSQRLAFVAKGAPYSYIICNESGILIPIPNGFLHSSTFLNLKLQFDSVQSFGIHSSEIDNGSSFTSKVFLRLIESNGSNDLLKKIKLEIINHGIDDQYRATIWPYLLEIYPIGCDSEQKDSIDNFFYSLYIRLGTKIAHYTSQQKGYMLELFQNIDCDVLNLAERTTVLGEHLKSIKDILYRFFSLQIPNIKYCRIAFLVYKLFICFLGSNGSIVSMNDGRLKEIDHYESFIFSILCSIFHKGMLNKVLSGDDEIRKALIDSIIQILGDTHSQVLKCVSKTCLDDFTFLFDHIETLYSALFDDQSLFYFLDHLFCLNPNTFISFFSAAFTISIVIPLSQTLTLPISLSLNEKIMLNVNIKEVNKLAVHLYNSPKSTHLSQLLDILSSSTCLSMAQPKFTKITE